jgi:hypothetical protein
VPHEAPYGGHVDWISGGWLRHMTPRFNLRVPFPDACNLAARLYACTHTHTHTHTDTVPALIAWWVSRTPLPKGGEGCELETAASTSKAHIAPLRQSGSSRTTNRRPAYTPRGVQRLYGSRLTVLPGTTNIYTRAHTQSRIHTPSAHACMLPCPTLALSALVSISHPLSTPGPACALCHCQLWTGAVNTRDRQS